MADKLLTWQEKLDQGVPLNSLEDTKADADYNVKQRIREQSERDAFEARKNRGRQVEPAKVESAVVTPQKGKY